MSTDVVFPESTSEAATLLADDDSVALAGATWIMRRGLRGEPDAARYVALDRIPGIDSVELGDRLLAGALVTHSALAESLADQPRFAGLRSAAADSANPNVRHVATIGGALGARGFPASDIVTALVALDAAIEVTGAGGDASTIAITDFLSDAPDPGLITGVSAGPPRCSAHERLTMRSAADYPAAIVSISVDGAGAPRIAVGSVEPVPRRWTSLETALGVGTPDPEQAAAKAADLIDDWQPRDSVELPAWYRAEILPELVRRAAAKMQQQEGTP